MQNITKSLMSYQQEIVGAAFIGIPCSCHHCK